MAICYLGKDYDEEHKYKCDYEVLGNHLSVKEVKKSRP